MGRLPVAIVLLLTPMVSTVRAPAESAPAREWLDQAAQTVADRRTRPPCRQDSFFRRFAKGTS